MPSPWIQHVKKYASDHNISYKEALKLSKPSYSIYGSVSTDPSTIKFNLNDDQYNLTAIKINPAFRKGDKTTHNVNIKYKSDETINKEPREREQIGMNDIDINPIIKINQQKFNNPNQRPKRQIAEYTERPESNIYNVKEIIEPTKINPIIKINQQKFNNPNQRPKRQIAEYTERPESNIYNVKEIIEPTKTRNKFIINKSKHKNQINKLTAKYEKIKNTDMSKYLNKKPVMNKPNKSTQNDAFSFLYEPEKVEIPKLSFSAPFKKYIYEGGIVPYTNIIIPNFNSPDEEINIYNTIITNYKNLITTLVFSKIPEDDKKTLMHECGENINLLTNKILKIQEEQSQREREQGQEQEQKGMNDINVNNKPTKTQVPTIQELLNTDNPTSLLKSKFKTQKERKDYFYNIFINIEKLRQYYDHMDIPYKEIKILTDDLSTLLHSIEKYQDNIIDKEIKTRPKQEIKQQDFIDELINTNYPTSLLRTNFKTKDEIERYFEGLYRKIVEKKEEISKLNLSLNDKMPQFQKYYNLQTKLENRKVMLIKQMKESKKTSKKN